MRYIQTFPGLLFLAALMGCGGGEENSSTPTDIIFEDNFDSQPDWFPQTASEACLFDACTNSLPVGWNYYTNSEFWHPNTYGSGVHPTMQISSENHFGASGKAFTQWNESQNGRSGSGWGANGILARDLGADYDEIYVRVHAKFQPGFRMVISIIHPTNIEMVRFYHWDRVGRPLQYSPSGANSPIYIYNTTQTRLGFTHFHVHRCDPQETNYYCSPSYDVNSFFTGNPSFGESLGDGNWHVLEFHGKMNSAPGVADGIIDFWADGTLEYSRADIEWMGATSPGGLGWNIVAIGGSAYNSYAPGQDMAEQWYALDNVVVSTTYIGPEYVIGSSSSSL